MADTPDPKFQNYKQAERKALDILAQMKSAGTNKVDIELAFLVAVFELHKGTAPAATVAAIVQGHLKQIVPYYASKEASAN
ncbi:hypothetical protein MASR2M8_01110 [Opitutaceae bacterium]